MVTINDKVWIGITVFLGCGIALQLHSIFDFQSEAQRLKIPYNHFGDLWNMMTYLIFITVFRWLIDLKARPMIQARLLEIDPVEFESKFEKNCRAFIGLLWYLFATVTNSILFIRPMA